MPTLAEAQQTAALAQNPGALYGRALGALHLSPAVQAALSPAGQQLFRAAYDTAVVAAGSVVTTLGDAALSGVTGVLGTAGVEAAKGIAGAVVEGVGDALPVVNMFMSIIAILDAFPKATGSPDLNGQFCIEFWSSLPGHSGPSDPVTGVTATTPADIFASAEGAYRMVGGKKVPSMRTPANALGMCLAAITECDPTLRADFTSPETFEDGTVDGWGGQGLLVGQDGPWHSCAVYDVYAPQWAAALWNAPGLPLGVPKEQQAVMRALRFAIGSNGPDRGVIPYGLWMDLLVANIDSGRLRRDYILYLLKHYFAVRTKNGLPTPVQLGDSGCPGAAEAMADQIIALAQSWKATRAKVNFAKIKLNLNLTQAQLAVLAIGAAKSDEERAALEHKAIAAGASPFDVAYASPTGYSAVASPLLNSATSAAILMPRLRARMAIEKQKPKIHLSFAPGTFPPKK